MRVLKIAAGVALFATLLSANTMAQDTSTATAPAVVETTATPADPATTADVTSEALQPADAVGPTNETATEPPGRIIFFRPGRLSGGIYTYHVVEVSEDGDSTRESPRIGSLPNGYYFEYAAPPGIHNYNIRGPMAVNLDEDRLRLEVESGETYYVEQTVRMGLITGGFRLVPSTQQEYERRRLRQWTPRESEDEGSN